MTQPEFDYPDSDLNVSWRCGSFMVFSAHNTDLGDGWEREGENSEYFHTFSETRAYPFAVNIVFYLMTH